MRKIQFIFLLLSKFLARYYRLIFRRAKFASPLSSINFKQTTFYETSASLKRKIAYLAFFLFCVLVALIIVKTSLSDQSSLSLGIVGTYSHNSLPPMVANLVSDPLVYLDKNGQPQAKLADWQVSENATVYTFKLKDNLHWHDGTVVKSSDIKFNFPDVEVSYPDAKTIVFKLADSFVPFPTLLTIPVFKGETLIGVGKFKVIKQETNKNITTKLILTPTANLSQPNLSIRFYPDEKIAKTAFELGEVDSLLGMNDLTDLLNQANLTIAKIPSYNKIVAIFYNTKDPILSDKNWRKALTSAAPAFEREEKARTSIQPNSWAYNDTIKDITNNSELTLNYWKKVQNGKDKPVVLTTVPSLSSVAERVVEAWKEASISAVLRVENGIPQNFQALLIAHSIPADPDQYALWHSTQTNTNLSHYKSDRVDKDLEDGRKSADDKVRKERYLDFQKILSDDAPATFLYFPKLNVVYRKRVANQINKVINLQPALSKI